MSSSVIEIKKSALTNNYRFLKSLMGNDVIVCAVVKGNAYGHGVGQVLPALQSVGVTHFAVFSSTEAQHCHPFIRQGVSLMVMGFIEPAHMRWIIEHEIEFYVYTPSVLSSAIAMAKILNKKACIHLDLETGMNRTGLTEDELGTCIPVIKENRDWIVIKGITTHFAGAESIANYVRVMNQFDRFKEKVEMLSHDDIHGELLHVASSAAAVIYPQTRLNMVRVGVMLYGYWPTREIWIQYARAMKNHSNPLQRSIVWKSEVMLVKDLEEGEFVGYGLGYQAPQNMRIMIVPVGYVDGYSRSLSNNGHVLVNGQRADVIGSINMNMVICNISDHASVEQGDEVILIGAQGDNEITFSSFAEMNNAMNYEILARLPDHVLRMSIP
ncbi:MAG: alanine racemase [Bacteroidia bacterium]|jgi:alanine racemase|nr:alanine racemase [Bacteroidales bacterium]NCD40927.1 alanine racemase [Bacteroidia bacterium]MDD2323516.1 alanine racemase [Bacteroidales bacterium]MDD3010843.1 alanine racemase [Bacteroidales bacterium]MDD3960448.1 alanine racemase [Bacteroidales bacterium]